MKKNRYSYYLAVIGVGLIGVLVLAGGGLLQNWIAGAFPDIQEWIKDNQILAGLMLLGLVAIGLLVPYIIERLRTGQGKTSEAPPSTVSPADRALILSRIQGEVGKTLGDKLPNRTKVGSIGLAFVEEKPGRRLEHPEQPSKSIAEDTPIEDVFNDAGKQMLLLGKGGAGKTVTLNQLAEALIAQARANPDAPIPVVLSLDSWANKKPPFEEWLVAELGKLCGGPSVFRGLATWPCTAPCAMGVWPRAMLLPLTQAQAAISAF